MNEKDLTQLIASSLPMTVEDAAKLVLMINHGVDVIKILEDR